MELMDTQPLWAAGGVLLILALLVFHRAIKSVGRLALRTTAGIAVLALFSKVSGFLGISLGVNLVNGLVLGVLGAPGFGLLLMLNWLLG